MNYEKANQETFDLVSSMLNETLQLRIVRQAENINEALEEGTLSQKGFRAARELDSRFDILADIQKSLIGTDFEKIWNKSMDLVKECQDEVFNLKMDRYVANWQERDSDGAVSKKGLPGNRGIGYYLEYAPGYP